MSDMKDTVTYPLSAIMGENEDRIEQLERELAEARDQLRLCNVDQFTTAAELAETSKALRIAAGLLSTYPKLSSEHPEYTLEYILNIAAMKEV
jgi:hypothetical protein